MVSCVHGGEDGEECGGCDSIADGGFVAFDRVENNGRAKRRKG